MVLLCQQQIKHTMKKISIMLMASAIVLGLMPSCKKKSTETTSPSTPPYQIGQAITPGNLAAGSYKGTMTTGNTYTLTGDPFIINAGDTLFLQPGVKVCVGAGVTIIVKGTLISMGTKAQPNWFTACGTNKIDQIGLAPGSDPAYSAKWTGINCDTTCKLLDLQWTHIEFTGGTFAVNEPFNGGTSGGTSYSILFQNGKGDFILTDSWLYGCIDDCIRFAGGRILMTRNTLEKMGLIGGDGLNAKHGTQGDMSYNLCIGNATNSTKCSDKGSGAMVQCNINMYNNTYVNCGYRQAAFGPRGSDIDYEQGGRGLCYNNLIVNCRNGIRIGMGLNAIPPPDTTNTIIGNNYIYDDSGHEVMQMYPVVAGTWTKANAYVVPTAAQFNLPVGFYSPLHNPNSGNDLNEPQADSVSLAMANNPMFVNFPLPEHLGTHDMSGLNSVETGVSDVGSAYDFHLSASSPAIGKGYTGFAAFTNIPNPVINDVTNVNFKATVTQPGVDIGCYQSNGSGNQH
jgi:hypothetical protein